MKKIRIKGCMTCPYREPNRVKDYEGDIWYCINLQSNFVLNGFEIMDHCPLPDDVTPAQTFEDELTERFCRMRTRLHIMVDSRSDIRQLLDTIQSELIREAKP